LNESQQGAAMGWFSETKKTTLKDVWAHLKKFYFFPPHHEFSFHNDAGNSLKSNRKTEVLTFGVADNPRPQEPRTYARICEIVLARYKATIPELREVKVWDTVKKDYVPGMTQAPLGL
jgi:hypothetical protein